MRGQITVAIASGLLASSFCTSTLAVTTSWNQGFGSPNNGAYGKAVSLDSNGNIILVGYFMGTIDFGAGPVSSPWSGDIFVVKFNANGNCLWSRAFGNRDLADLPESVSIDAQGRVAVVGHSVGTIDFGGGPLSGAGDFDVFVAVFGPDGEHLWSRKFGDQYAQYAYSVASGLDGSVVLTGSFFPGSIDFGGGPHINSSAIPYRGDVFIAKFSSDGQYVWSRSFGDELAQNSLSVAVDATGRTDLAGYFSGTVDFGTGPMVSTSVAGFVVQFDNSGNAIWSKAFESAIPHLAIDSAGSIYLAGIFGGQVSFGGRSFTSVDELDVFAAKLDSDGAHLWSQAWVAPGDQHFTAISASDEGCAISGQFRNMIDLGTGPLFSAGEIDAFVAVLNNSGSCAWYERFGDANEQAARSVSIKRGEVVMAGEFSGSIDFGDGPLVAQGYSDAFLVKFQLGSTTGARATSLSKSFRVYPNPSTASSHIEFTVSEARDVRVAIYDVSGRLVKLLTEGVHDAGKHGLSWDGQSASGSRVSAGVYFCRLEAGPHQESRKILVIR